MKKWTLMLLISLFFALFSIKTEAGRKPVPAYLAANLGQFDPQVDFQGRIGSTAVWLARDAVWLTVPGAASQGDGTQLRLDFGQPLDWRGVERLATRINRYAGTDPSGWLAGIPVWGAAEAELEGVGRIEVDGAGIRITGEKGRTIPRFEVAGAPVRLEGGKLFAAFSRGPWILPLSSDGAVSVNGQTGVLEPAGLPDISKAAGGGLVWSTYIGGINIDEGESVLRDAAGSVYISGETQSLFFPTAPGPFEAPHAVEAFAAKMDADGTSLLYLTVFNYDVEDWAPALALDGDGNAYLAGRTDSTDFVTTAGAYQENNNGSFDAFLIKLDPDGKVVYSTLLGGAEDEITGDLLVDSQGAAYLTGATFSSGLTLQPAFPTTPDAYARTHNGSRDVFVAKISPDGSSLDYGTFVGGTKNDHGEGLAIFGSQLVVAGWTTSPDFAVPAGGYDTGLSGTFDAFVFALTPGSSSLDYWSYLGGNDGASITGERALDLVLDANGAPVLVGSTVAADFPATPGAFDGTYGGGVCSGFPCSDGFAAKLSADGKSLLWATFLGGQPDGSGLCDGVNKDFGDCDDVVNRLVMESTGDLVLVGVTDSENFPVSLNAFDGTLDGGRDGFIARLAGDGGALPYATFIGGSDANMNGKGADALTGVWVDAAGVVTVTGWSDAADYPTTAGSFDPNHNEDMDVVVTVLALPTAQPLPFSIFLPVVVRK